MLKIGLTGGIGSGKSTIADLFHHLFSIPVIDADIIARQLAEPGQPAYTLILQTFGQDISNADHSLNRDALRQLIYSSPGKKKQLETILHPLVYQQMQSEFNQQKSPYSILCIPLLLETKMTAFVDRILVVDCPVQIQIDRVLQRDSLPKDQVISIISTQASREQRLSYASDIIDNSNSSNLLAEQVKKLHNQYLLLP
jgi:dephospho-CoA kinase